MTVLTVAGLAGLGLVLAPTSALAGAPLVVHGEELSVVCEGRSGDRSVVLTLEANSDQFGATNRGDITVSDAGGTVVLWTEEGTGTVVREEGTFTGVFTLLDADGGSAGAAPFSVSVTPAGEATTHGGVEQVGNVRQEITETSQAVLGTGTVHLPGTTVAALDCTGGQTTSTIRTTQPDASTQRIDILNLSCTTTLPDGRVLGVTVEGGVHDLVGVSLADAGSGVGGEVEDAQITRTDVSASVPLYSRSGEEVGQAVVDLHIDGVTGRDRYRLQQANRTQFFTKQTLVGSGSVQVPGEGTIAVACHGERTLTHEVATSPAGPKPAGPAPTNDTVGGAALLGAGDRTSTQTRGTTPAPEADLWCYDNEPEDPGVYPEHTVWYRFVGTGEPMTVDTAGSSFNTTLAIYQVENGTLERVACVDDGEPPVTTWQASASIDTEVGREYLLQVGGIGGEHGLLKIALR